MTTTRTLRIVIVHSTDPNPRVMQTTRTIHGKIRTHGREKLRDLLRGVQETILDNTSDLSALARITITISPPRLSPEN